MILELKENVPHGTKEYPYDQYFIRHVPHAFQFPVHWHEELEIIYIKQGTLEITIDNTSYTGHAGSIFLVNPRELHFMGSTDLSVAYYTLLFPLEFISFQSMDHLESSLFQPLRSGQLLFSHTIPDANLMDTLTSILDEIIPLNRRSRKDPRRDEISYNQTSPSRQIETRILLLQFFLKIIDDGSLIMPSVPGKQSNMQRELLAYIENHYTEKISLQDLAACFHLSEKYVSRYFKEHFHLTFSDYVNHLRLTHAKKLLETTELSVTQVALDSGYSNVSYFIRSFKKIYDCSPLKYRKAAKRPVALEEAG